MKVFKKLYLGEAAAVEGSRLVEFTVQLEEPTAESGPHWQPKYFVNDAPVGSGTFELILSLVKA